MLVQKEKLHELLADGMYVLFMLRTIVLLIAMVTAIAFVKDFQVIHSVVRMRKKVQPPESQQ